MFDSGLLALGQIALGQIALGRIALGRIALGRIASGRIALGRIASVQIALGQSAFSGWNWARWNWARGNWARLFGVAVVMALAMPVALLQAQPVGPPTDGSTDPVAEAGQALADGGFRWYDEATDDLRPLRVLPSEEPRKRSESASQATTWLAWVFLIVLGLLLVGIPLYLAFNRAPPPTLESSVPRRLSIQADRIVALPVQLDPKSDNLLEESQKHFRLGDYKQALIYLFSHQLLVLDQAHFIRLSRGKTNRQYLRELRRHRPDLASLLEPNILAFEQVYFGQHAIDQTRYQQCWEQFRQMEQRLPGGS